MATPTVLAPFPVLSQAFSALSQPTLASLSSASGGTASASRPLAGSSKQVVKLQLSGSVGDSREQRGQKDLQVLRRSLMVLLTPPPTFPPAASTSSSATATSAADGSRLALPPQAALPASLQQLYGAVRVLSNSGSGADVWNVVRLAVERGAGSLGGAIRASAPPVADVREDVGDWALWLGVVLRGWTWWKAVTSTLRSILLPLTQTSPVAYPLQTLIDAAMSGLFVNAGDVQMRTTYSLLAAINVRRKAVTVAVAQSEVHTPPIDQVVVDIVCDLLVPLALLEDVFTDCLGDISNDFYGDLIQAHSPFETARPGQLAPVINHTLLTAAHLRADEELYAQLLLPPGIVTVLLKALLKTMMQADWIPRLIGDGLAVLLVNFAPLSNASDAKGKATETAQQREAENGLATLASLVRRVGQGGELRGPWGDWVRKQVESVICDPVNDAKMVPSLLAFRETISALLRGPLALPSATEPGVQDEDKQLRDASSSAFQTGMGSRKNKPAEMIAKEIDVLLRSKATSADSVDAKLDSLLTLVRYTRDKDVFRAFYVAALAKRLLLNRSSSEDAELKMVTRLKKELGEDFMKGDGMMADLKLSEGLMKGYRARVAPVDDMDLSVNVLSAANWPTYPALDKGWEAFALPPALNAALEGFRSFYLGAHQGRMLDWRYQLFQMTLKANFSRGGKKELGVSLWQGLVLLAFEDVAADQRKTFGELREETGIEREELRRTLQSLACGKERVLVKHPKGRDVADTDAFTLNDDYTSDRFRVKINQIQQTQTKEEDDKTESRVMHDRSHLLDAAIVRIMKSKKRMAWNDLTNAVVDAVRNKFPPEPKAIKIQIESLIEREYLERGDEDEGGRKSLTYLA